MPQKRVDWNRGEGDQRAARGDSQHHHIVVIIIVTNTTISAVIDFIHTPHLHQQNGNFDNPHPGLFILSSSQSKLKAALSSIPLLSSLCFRFYCIR